MTAVDRGAYESLIDAVSAGSQSSGASPITGGVRSPYMDRPWAGREELLMTEATRMALVPADEIRKIRPIVPQTLFPDDGISYDRTALTIEEALSEDRWRPSMRTWISGPSRVVRRSDMQEDAWSGSMRNVSMSVNPTM